MNLIYEVNLQVDAAIADEFRGWLAGHVAQMVQLPGFLDAETLEVLEPRDDVFPLGWSVRYRLLDARALDDYLQQHASRMRAAGIERFGERFRASRRVLRLSAA